MTKPLELAQLPSFIEANTTSLTVNATSYAIGSSFVANTTGVFHTGTVNASSIATTGFVANTTAIAPTSNTILLGNSTNRFVLSANTGSFSGAVSGITTLAAGNTTITGFANASVSVNSALITVGTSFVANTTGAYHTGVINAASLTTTGFVANTTAIVPTSNTILLGNTTGRFVISANTIDTSGNTNTFGTAVYIAANGNVGIGTASPAAKLQIVSDIPFRLNNAASSSQADLYFADSGATLKVENFFGTGSAITFGTNANGAGVTEKARIDSSGNFGIGTSSPNSKLEVNSGATATTAQLKTTAATAYSGGSFFAGSNLTIRTGANATGSGSGIRFTSDNNGGLEGMFGWVQNTSTYGDFVWQSYNGSYGERMRLDSAGNLGIGTSSPSVKLEVANTGGSVAARLRSSDSGYAELYFGDVSDGAASALSYEHSTNLLRFYNGGSVRATLDSSGNLGLGVTPSTWSSASRPALQLTNGAALFSRSGSTMLSQNFFYNNSDTGTYIANGFATLYNQASGQHQWFNTPSGTANNTASLTQAMTLDASGNLGIGTSSPLSRLDVAVEATLTRRLLVNFDDSVITIKGGNNQSNPESMRLIADNFRINTGTSGSGTERMRVDASGNLGIGTTSPSYQVMILRRAGSTITAPLLNLQSQNSGSVDGDSFILYGTQSANWAAGVDQADSNKFRIEPALSLGAEAGLTITTSGNLGIGTASPLSRLHVSGADTVIRLVDTNGGTCFWGDDATGVFWRSFVYDTFRWLRASGNESMRIDSSGNLGIGTSSPSAEGRLTVGSTTVTDKNGIIFNRGAVGTPTGLQGGIFYEYNGLSTSEALTFRTNGGYKFQTVSGPTSFATIDISGYLTVGSAPSTNVNRSLINVVSSSGNTCGISFAETAAGGRGRLNWTGSGVNLVNIDNSLLTLGTTDTTRISINATGVVTLSAYGAGTLTTSASGVISASDGRFKYKTRPVENAISLVTQLIPTYYRWNEDCDFYTEYEELGFVAQEVAAVIPEASPEIEKEPEYMDDGVTVKTNFYKNYSDRAIMAVLVKAIQEQQALITQLTARLDAANL